MFVRNPAEGNTRKPIEVCKYSRNIQERDAERYANEMLHEAGKQGFDKGGGRIC